MGKIAELKLIDMKALRSRSTRELRGETAPLALLVAFCVLTCQSSSAVMRAEETPVSSAMPAATAAAGSLTVTPTPSPVVRWVGGRDSNGETRKVPKAYAGRGDEIWVDVFNFKDWLKSLEGKQSGKWAPKDLILFLNHVPLLGVHPFYWYDWNYKEGWHWDQTGKLVFIEYPVTTFGFSLVRNEDSKLAWSHLLNKPGFNRKVVVSVGFENGEEIRTEQTPDDEFAKKIAKDMAKLREKRKKIPLSDKDALENIDRELQKLQVAEDGLRDKQFY
jgi:hypothetical protein